MARMEEAARDVRTGAGAFAVLALALAGFAFSLGRWCDRLDLALLDREWMLLRAAAPREAPGDIVIVGVDEASLEAVPQPPGAWNQPLGEVLVRVASGKPRAMALALPLPDRSLDVLGPGLDRALLVGLAAARANGPFVVALPIDPSTHAARPIFDPYYAVLGKERLGIDLWPRDDDGVTRRFSLAVPTQDGGFATFDGRLCQMLSGRCREGLIDFSLGAPYRYTPFHEVLAMRDAERVRTLFRDRIVLIGEASAHSDRIAVPINLAAWEPAAPDSPGIVLHAQALRTAMLGTAPAEAPRPAAVLLLALAALLVLVRDVRVAVAGAVLGAAGLFALGAASLHAGVYLPIGAALATLAAALASGIVLRRRPPHGAFR
jgi:CHASE2 domain-containing sensor protein